MKIDQETINKYVEGINNTNTKKTYKLSLNNFITYLESSKIGDVSQENINTVVHDYKAYLNRKDYKPTTINQHLIILKTFINDYTHLEYTQNLKLVKTEKRKPKYLTREQIQTALDYTDDKTDELMIKLLSSTGLRIHEALNITRKQLENTDTNGNALIEIISYYETTEKTHY